MSENSEKTGSGIRLLLSTREAAQALAVSERTLWALTQQGDVPVVRFGRSVRYPLDGLKGWIVKRQCTDITSRDTVQLETQGILKKLQEAQKLITESMEDLTRGEKSRKDRCGRNDK